MLGWQWLVMGMLLLGAEMFLIDAQFYLVFLGVAAVLVGGAVWSGLSLSTPEQFLLFAVLSVVALLLFRKQLYQKLRQPDGDVPEALSVGDHVVLTDTLVPGQTSRVEYRGTTWLVRNVDTQSLSGEVVISHVEGLTLLVKQSR